MTPAEFTATRRLIGLTSEQLGQKLTINPRTVRRWESGSTVISDGAEKIVHDLRAAHDLDFNSCLEVARRGEVVSLPPSDGDRPGGWWSAVASRIIDRIPTARIIWA